MTPPLVETPPLPVLLYEITGVDAVLQTGNELLATPPIVNTIFFGQNSSELPDKYLYSRISRDENFFEINPVEAHRYLLLRISDILQRNPQGRIVLEGSTSGNDEEGIGLARRRAETVKNALVRAGVPENKISTRGLLLPRNPSNQEYPQGREENRRVDILLQNAPLQEYVARQQFAQVSGTINSRVTAQNTSDGEVTAQCTDTIIGFTRSTSLRIPFLCRVGPDQQFLTLRSSAGTAEIDRVDASYELDLSRLPQEQIALRTEDFIAILRFDYNSSELSAANRELLRQLVERIPNNSELTISGTSDALGSQERNVELSNARAKVTEDFIRSVAGNRLRITAGKGEAQFPDDTPEGRFLNRSIIVRIQNAR